ncbi:MAG TPA: hypothetical protein VHC63_02765 [Acidimicrobiales bacterium]|nr:hypothetical protein [Acidimicrobiales bacterium]
MNLLAVVDHTGQVLKSWTPLYLLLGAFAAIVVGLVAFGRSGDTRSPFAAVNLRIADGLERIVHVPGWAAATVGLAFFSLLVAGQGFYNDVAWHVALGRDKNLFTAPHTGIVIGLGLILFSGIIGVLFASLQGVDTALRWRAVRIPWSTLPLLALGAAAVTGFPLDDLWHAKYGVDVTMWSPTHMLMILGASFVGIAAWLVLADAGVKPHDSRWSMGIHVVAAWLTFQGLIAPLGEFSFGVPQFQQIFHPMILVIASAFAFVAIRLVIGRWWGLAIAAFNWVTATGLLNSGKDAPIHTRVVGLYVASALAVEIAAFLFGTERRIRFAVAAGVGVATLGLAGDFWWNAHHAYQPWNHNLVRGAVGFGLVVGIASAILATAFARSAGRQEDAPPVRGPVAAVAGLVILVCLALPMPRHTGDVTAAVHVGRTVGGYANVSVQLTPANAAAHARFFQAGSWQGGGLVLADMKPSGAPGHYVSTDRVPVYGKWKALLRLHTGNKMMAVPLYLPGDAEIHKPEIPFVDRTMKFQPEPKYLLRETHGGGNALKDGVFTLLTGVAILWIAAFCVAIAKIAPREQRVPPTSPGKLRANPVTA